jgi:hypothetical protein
MTGVGTILYGHAAVEALPGGDALRAEAEGFHPFSFEAIRWFTVLYFPILPLGTYRVVKPSWLTATFPITPWPSSARWARPGQTTQPRVNRVSWRWDLVGLHYLVAWGAAFVLFHIGEWVVPGAAPR